MNPKYPGLSVRVADEGFPSYIWGSDFSFEVAARRGDGWQAIAPVQQPWTAPVSGMAGVRALMAAMWKAPSLAWLFTYCSKATKRFS